MKNILSENMLRFGVKNLSESNKKRLTLESIMQTINEHGLVEEVKQRLIENQAPSPSHQLYPALPLVKAGKAQSWAKSMVALLSLGGGTNIAGFIKPGKYPMTFNGDPQTSMDGSVTVDTGKMTFTYATQGNASAPSPRFVIEAVNNIVFSQADNLAADPGNTGTKLPQLPEDAVNAKYFLEVSTASDGSAIWNWISSTGKNTSTNHIKNVGAVQFKGQQSTPE
jgi:hypothetical protein